MKKTRHLEMLRLFVNRSDYISAQMIANELQVSVRTIYSDLDNHEFSTLLHGAYLDKRPNVGIKLCATKAQMDKIFYELDKTETNLSNKGNFNDIQAILFTLLLSHNAISIDDLALQLYKSKNSISLILDQVQAYAQEYHCLLSRKQNLGIQLKGDEKNIRRMFRVLIQEHISKTNIPILNFLTDMFHADFVDTICDHISLSQQLLNTHYTDYDYQILVIKLCICIKRIQLGYSIEFPIPFDNALQEYYVATILKMKLEESFHITITRQEHCDLATAILATRKTDNNRPMHPSFDESVIDKFIIKISDHLDVDLLGNEELKINLINHLRPAIRRIKHGSPSENPLLNHIRYKFTYVYIAVMITIDEIENQEHIYFDANELSFICLHIVAALNRKSNQRLIHTLLITNDGLTISSYIQSFLEKQFSEIKIDKIANSVEINEDQFDTYDLILDTTQRYINCNHMIFINAILEESDFASIRHWLYYQELENAMIIRDHLKDYILMFHDDSINKLELLKKYCGYLVETGYVKEGFFDSVIERENKSTTSIGRGVAVPHGSIQMVNKSVILIIRTKTKIVWDELEVDTIFLTAIDGSHSSDYNYFFKQLFHVVEDEKQLELLKHSKNIQDIEKLLFPSKK